MFHYMYTVYKDNSRTTYGSISIKHIAFDPLRIEDALPDIVFEEKNLMHMFAETELDRFKKYNICNRFTPQSNMKMELDEYIEKRMDGNANFYSFLAEGILGLVYRDVYGYELAKGVIDVMGTLEDTHTGVDACMYNLKKKVIVLGEAKFYKSLEQAIRAIIADFKKNNIQNKLESLHRNSLSTEDIYKFVIKNLGKEDFSELTVEEFVNQKIVFAGFVLHSEDDVTNYSNENFYDKYNINIEQLKENIAKCLEVEEVFGDYEIVLVHLPIKDKKKLIIKMIDKAKEELRRL